MVARLRHQLSVIEGLNVFGQVWLYGMGWADFECKVESQNKQYVVRIVPWGIGN